MPTKQSPIAAAVFETVAWFDVFDHAPTAEEIHRFLFGRRATLAAVKMALYSDSRIEKSLNCFYLQGRGGLVLKRTARQMRTDELWQRVKKWHWLLRSVPFVRLIAVGNTLAFGWPSRESDIDLFVVAERKWLFTARLFLTAFASLARIRRSGDRIAGRFCLSFFVADSAQNLEKIQLKPADPYLAFWIANLKPIVGSAEAFRAANPWLAKKFPNLPQLAGFTRATRQNWFAKFLEILIRNPLGQLAEKGYKKWQLRRARAKRGNKNPGAVIISESMLKFHESDRRAEYAAAWQARLEPKKKALRLKTKKK